MEGVALSGLIIVLIVFVLSVGILIAPLFIWRNTNQARDLLSDQNRLLEKLIYTIEQGKKQIVSKNEQPKEQSGYASGGQIACKNCGLYYSSEKKGDLCQCGYRLK